MSGLIWPFAVALLTCCAPQQPKVLSPEAPLSFVRPMPGTPRAARPSKPIENALTDAIDAARAARDANGKFYGPDRAPASGAPY